MPAADLQSAWRSGSAAIDARPMGIGGLRRRRISTLLLACSVALPLGLLADQAWMHWNQIWASSTQEIQRSSDAVAEYSLRVLSAHAVLAARIDALVAGLSDDQVRAREAELHRQMQDLVAEMPPAKASFVLDREGQILVSSNIFPMPETGSRVADRGYFRALQSEGAPEVHVSRVHVGRLNQAQFFAVSRRRSATGKGDGVAGGFNGVISVSVAPDRMAPRLARLAHRPTDTAALVREDGQLLARSIGQAGPIRASEEFMAAVRGRPQQAVYEGVANLDGRRRLYAATQVEGWPVYTVVGRERAAIVGEWRARVLGEVPTALLAMTLMLGLSLGIRRREQVLADSNLNLEWQLAGRVAQLAQSEARLRSALEAGRLFAFEMDLDRRRISRSANAAGILGLPVDAAAEQDTDAMVDALVPEDRVNLIRLWDRLSPESPHDTVRLRFRRPDGSIVCLESEGRGQFDAAGRLVRVSGLTRDVTAEVEAEAAREAAQTRLLVAMEGAGFGIYEVDLARGAAWFDGRAAAVLQGVVPEESWIATHGAGWAALRAAVHADDRPRFEAAWLGVVTGAQDDWSMTFRIVAEGGDAVWVWCHGVVPDRDRATGRPGRLVGILQDVSASHRLAAELRQGQKLQVLGELAAGIAHDLNNVLQVIAGQAALARRKGEDAAKVQERLVAVGEAVENGASITRRLLSFSRRSAMRTEVLAPARVLEDVRAMVAAGLGKAIRLEVVAPGGLPAIRADGEQLKTALMNLVTNARDAMAGGGVLELGAAVETVGPARQDGVPRGVRAGRHVRLWARDTGEGMDAATLARVAEPFFTTKPDGKGTGLGLAMVKTFAERSGGAMTVQSARGRGTVVTIWLPCEAEGGGKDGVG